MIPYIVLFSWATGGNHVANMMTTSAHLEPRSSLFSAYNNPIGDGVHTGDVISTGWADSQYIINRITTSVKSRIFPCHYDGLYRKWGDLKPFLTNARCVVLEWNEGSQTTRRPNKWDIPSNDEQQLYNEREITERFSFDTLGIPIQDLFQPSALSVWQRISDRWDLNMNFDACNHFHDIWFNKIIHMK
jgi:hypothetical protein